MELSRKITAATLSKGHNLRNLETEVYLGRIVGFAKTHDVVTTQYGEADRIIGEFVATRADGEMNMASTCYLPSVVSKLVVNALQEKDNQGVKFGFDISAAPNPKSATGYEWKIKPLMEVKASAGMLEFAASFPPVPGLASPVENAKEPEPAAPTHGKKK